MRTFAQKPKAPQHSPSATTTVAGRTHTEQRDSSQLPRFLRVPIARARLTAGGTGDTSEQEADRASDQVMRMSAPVARGADPGGRPAGRTAQPGREHESPQATGLEASESGGREMPAIVRDVLHSPAQPLDPAVRAFMEPRFGYDLGSVRVHTGATAEQSARALGASAYTAGRNIVFAGGQYAPHSVEGRGLIAHELTHVVQQRGGGASVQRRPAPGKRGSVEFRAGIEIGAPLASAATKIAKGGVTLDELKGLRAVALSEETIDHEERGFLAGLLDAANASTVAAGGTSFVFSQASIDAHLAEVTGLDRPRLDEAVITAFKKKWQAVAEGDLPAIDTHVREEEEAAAAQMARLVGRDREPKLRAVVAYAAANGVNTPQLLTTMLSAASDATAGDFLMTAMAYAVARAVGHNATDELADGRIKVDQVPQAQLGTAAASYSAEGAGKNKGDTIYVPESLSIDNVAHRSQIIHELQHAAQDRSASHGLIRVAVEASAYREQARYLLDQLAALTGTAQEAAVKQTAKITTPTLIRALILESRRKQVFELMLVDINDAMPAYIRLNLTDLAKFIRMDEAELMKEMESAILADYRIGARDIGPGAGLRGEHDVTKM